jgi:hypothetical protein
LCASLILIRMMKSKGMRMAKLVARMGETGNSYKILVGKPEEKRTLGRPSCRLDANVSWHPKNVGWEGVD